MKRILQNFLILTTFFLLSNALSAQFWTEDFATGACGSGQLATVYSGSGNTSSASWTETPFGFNGPIFNSWYVTSEEPGPIGLPTLPCGDPCANGPYTNQSLHISTHPTYLGDVGAQYEAGAGFCGFLPSLCPITDRRIESPTVSCVGQSNIQLTFSYMENGQGTTDNMTLEYFDGTTWSVLNDPAKTAIGCAPQGTWTSFSYFLPGSADGNANVKIGFRWINDDGLGTDPSCAIDDIAFTSIVAGNPEVQWVTTSGSETEDTNFYTAQIQITNPDPLIATSVEVNITTGDLSRLTTWGWVNPTTYTFPAGSSAVIDVDLLFDDDICQEIELYTLTLQNVTAPTLSPTIGVNNPHLFTLTDDEMQYRTSFTDDFENPLLFGIWQSPNPNWTQDIFTPITGSISMDYTATAGTGTIANTAISTLYSSDCLNGVDTEWNMNILYPVNPTPTERLAIVLTGAGLPGQEYGYGLFVGEAGGFDVVGLVRVDAGAPTVIFAAPLTALVGNPTNWPTATAVNLAVNRNTNGDWSITMDGIVLTDGGTFLQSVNDPTHIHMGAMGFGLDHTVLANGRLKVDDISVTIKGCQEEYYSQATGSFEGNIWDVTAGGGLLNPAVSNQFSRFTIQNGHVVTQMDQECVLDLAVDLGGTYTFTPFPWSLGIHGDMIIDGAFIPMASNIAFGGHDVQILGGSTPLPIQLSSMTLANDNLGVLMGTDVAINNILLPLLGNLDIFNSDLILQSSVIGTGGIFSMQDNPLFPGFSPFPYLSDIVLSGTGEIVMQRHINPDAGADGYPGGWVGLSNPLPGQDINDWNDDLITTGFPGSNFPSYAYPGGVLFNNIIHWDAAADSWQGALGLGDVLDPFDGYFVYMNEFAQDVDVQGNINRGDQHTALNFPGGGWNLMSNPYPCEIDWRVLYNNFSTDLSSILYIYDSDARVYNTFDATAGSGAIVIASSQTFWVRATGAAASLHYEENVKTLAPSYVFERTDENTPLLTLTLSDGSITDQSYLGFKEEATNEYDAIYDGEKLNIPFPGTNQILISSLSTDNYELVYNYYGTLLEGVEIPVKINVGIAGEFTFGIENILGLEQSTCILVHDLFTDEIVSVTEDLSYTFTTDDAYEGVRFNILFGAPLQVEKEDITCNGLTNGSATVEAAGVGPFNYTWYDENEVLVAEQLNVEGASTLDNLSFGNYVVVVTSENGLCNSVSEVIYIDEPQVESVEFYSNADLCSNSTLGEIIIEGQTIEGEYTFEISLDGDVVETGTTQGYLSRMLAGGVYNVVVNSTCLSYEYEADLRDPNAPTVEIVNAIDEVEFIDGEATIELLSDNSNVENMGWMINEVFVSSDEVLNYTFTEEGVYTVSLIGIGAGMSCNASETIEIVVSTMINVDELIESNIDVTRVSGGLLINLNNEIIKTGTLQVINTLGQIIINDEINSQDGEFTKNISSLSQGAYIVKIMNENNTLYSGKFVK